MAIVYVGIDLAKNVFAAHGINEAGKPELVRPSVPRARLHELVAALPPCTIAMEACSGGHHWARLFSQHGHTVRLIAPKFVAPYRMSGARGENDAGDAAAICEAVQRPNMRFVPVKSLDQQARLMVHRARQGYVQARTACINRVRGLLPELGIVLPLEAATVRRAPAPSSKTCPAGPTPWWATCSVSCTAWMNASRSTTATSRPSPARTSARRAVQAAGMRLDEYRWPATTTSSTA